MANELVVKTLKQGDSFLTSNGRQIVCYTNNETSNKITVHTVDSDKFEGWKRFRCGASMTNYTKTPEGIILKDCTDFKGAD